MTRYWFKPRGYGYGATPVTWESWLATLACVVLLIGSIVAMDLLAGRSNFAAWMVWAAAVAGIVFCFVRVSRRRTDGEWRWRWGAENKS